MQRNICALCLCLIGVSSVQAQTLDQFNSMPDWVRALLWAPGVAQIYLGQPEGYVYAAVGAPTLVAGTALEAWYLTDSKADAEAWKIDAGILLSDIGGSMDAYSLWAYLRDFEDAKGFSGPRRGRESYLTLLSAPYDPAVSLDYRALPIVALELAAFLTPDTIATMGSYFQRSTADFAGMTLPAPAALALETGYALVVNLFVAVTEETSFRGVGLEILGPLWISVIFGAVHLTNLFFQEHLDAQSITRVALQSGFATIAGFYLAQLTIDKGYDLRPAIAYHYWHNVVAMITGFLYDAGKQDAAGTATDGTSGVLLQLSPVGMSLSIPIP